MYKTNEVEFRQLGRLIDSCGDYEYINSCLNCPKFEECLRWWDYDISEKPIRGTRLPSHSEEIEKLKKTMAEMGRPV